MTRRTIPFGLRMPDDLKDQVATRARDEDRSMNSFIIRAVRQALENTASAPSA